MKLLSCDPLQLEISPEEYQALSSAVRIASGGSTLRDEMDAIGIDEDNLKNLKNQFHEISRQIGQERDESLSQERGCKVTSLDEYDDE